MFPPDPSASASAAGAMLCPNLHMLGLELPLLREAAVKQALLLLLVFRAQRGAPRLRIVAVAQRNVTRNGISIVPARKDQVEPEDEWIQEHAEVSYRYDLLCHGDQNT